jgi:hypothetical protein
MKQGGQLTGFTVDLWNAITNRLGYTYNWIDVQSIDALQQTFQDGKADIIVMKLIITAEREKTMDFTLPYFVSGLQIMVGEQRQSFFTNLVTTIFRPELLQVLGFALLTLVIMAHIIWLVERGSNEAIPKAYLPGVWESLWWALSTIATLEYGDKEKPRSPLKRLMAMVLVVLGIILIAQFTAAITASMTVQQLGTTITGPGDRARGASRSCLPHVATADRAARE